ncbi:MAG: hypothetical protein K6G76_12620 [Lachnospiraceae bacterium]|nr:hypothetical protein [Lachnospiraceae bacterium]
MFSSNGEWTGLRVEIRARRRIEEGSGIDMNRAELALKRALVRLSLKG